MLVDFTLEMNEQDFSFDFGAVQEATDGGFERGYAAGYEAGSAEGYTKGHAEGMEQGYCTGYAEGEESRYSIEDKLLAKNIVEYYNPRPVTIGNRFFSYCYNLILYFLLFR